MFILISSSFVVFIVVMVIIGDVIFEFLGGIWELVIKKLVLRGFEVVFYLIDDLAVFSVW